MWSPCQTQLILVYVGSRQIVEEREMGAKRAVCVYIGGHIQLRRQTEQQGLCINDICYFLGYSPSSFSVSKPCNTLCLLVLLPLQTSFLLGPRGQFGRRLCRRRCLSAIYESEASHECLAGFFCFHLVTDSLLSSPLPFGPYQIDDGYLSNSENMDSSEEKSSYKSTQHLNALFD